MDNDGDSPINIPNSSIYLVNILPDEVLLITFRFLSVEQLLKVEQVCVRWKSIVDTCFATMKTLDLRSFGELSGIKWMRRYGPSVNTFIMPYIREKRINSFNWIKEIGDAFPNLLSLDLQYIRIEDEWLRELSVKCRKLNNISFEYCKFSDNGLGILLKALPGLKILKCRGCDAELGECFRHLGSKVEHLEFNYSTSLEISSAGASQIFSRSNNLKTLKIGHGFQCNDTLTFSRFCKKVPLQTLSINSAIMPSEMFGQISHLALLEKLELYFCPVVDSDMLIRIGQQCPNLRIVTLGGLPLVTDAGVKSFANCRHLTELVCCDIEQMTDESLFELAKVGALEYLSLEDCDISDRGVAAVLGQCPNLYRLIIDSGRVGDDTVDAAIQAVESRGCSAAAKYVNTVKCEGGKIVLTKTNYLLVLTVRGAQVERYKDDFSHPLLHFSCNK